MIDYIIVISYLSIASGCYAGFVLLIYGEMNGVF